MPRLIDRSPFPKDPSEVVVRGERVRLRANQIILWVSLTTEAAGEPNPSAAPFPAILDAGHNHSFSIHERHLVGWAGLRPAALDLIDHTRHLGRDIPLRAAKIWVHPNEPRHRERLADRPPHLVTAGRGIGVYPPGDEFPRLPILGLRAIAENRLVLDVSGPRREATLRTPARWWPFG
jgi:hypothetical protein